MKTKEQSAKKVMQTTTFTRSKAQLFPITHRLVKRKIRSAELVGHEEIREWFESTSLRLGEELNTAQKVKAIPLLYTGRDIFETDHLRIQQTDLIEHVIVLMPGAISHHVHIPLYTEQVAFCRRLIFKMEEVGLIFRCDSEWGARTMFP